MTLSDGQSDAVEPRRIKVCILSSSYPLTERSSSGTFVRKLVESLPNDIAPVVLAPADNLGTNATTDRTKVVAFRYAPRRLQILSHQPGGIPAALHARPWLIVLVPIFLASMAANCFRLAKNADVIHANWSINGVVAGIIGRLRGRPVVCTLRGSDVHRAAHSFLYRCLVEFCFRTSNAVVTVSDAMSADVKPYAGDFHGTLQVIPNGVGDEYFSLRPDRANMNAPLRISTVCSLVKGKGLTTLIEALSQPGLAHAQLTIVGDGPERSSLEQLAASLHLSARVSFAGQVPPSRIPGYLEKTDVFVLPTLAEGRSNAVLEAMAASLPVIATAIPGMDEIIQDGQTGLLFPAGDVRALADKLMHLQKNTEQREKLGNAARNFLLSKKMTWSASAESYATIYRGLAITPQKRRH